MTIDRREFFRRATAAAVGALTLDPERLLWVPGQRMFFDIVRSEPVFTDIGRLIVEYDYVREPVDYLVGFKTAPVIISGRWKPRPAAGS